MKKFFLILSIFTIFIYAAKSPQRLTIITRNAPTTFYYDNDNAPAGFEYDLIKAFAQARGYRLRVVVQDSVHSVLDAMARGRGDIAAAGLTETAERKRKLLAGPPYLSIHEEVVCRAGVHPKTPADLVGKRIEVISKSSYIETMKMLRKKVPSLKWLEHKGYTTEHIFERMYHKKVDCTVADSNIVQINHRYYPHMNVAFTVQNNRHLVWYFPKNAKGRRLRTEVQKWFASFKKSAKFKHILDRHFGHLVKFDYVDTARYHKRIQKRLPKYLASFRRAGKKYGISWQILAAQAYQESHWNPKAKSPTGVRGMMMLTRTTARQLGIKNRMNYRQSIEGGAKYLSQLMKRIPKKVRHSKNRIKFALAAYNIGMGHLYDAIRLGKQLGIDPYQWRTLKILLPKLAQRKYHKMLKYGYARGTEPVRYVTRIENYYDILVKYHPR